MPVPVPPVPTVHPVHKRNKSGDSIVLQSPIFNRLKHTLPLSPAGPPPSFGSREQWINSLPSWRRAKTRYVWETGFGPATPVEPLQDFSNGLAGAVDAPAIKGARVQTCIPPPNILASCDSEMSSCGPTARDHSFNPAHTQERTEQTPTGDCATCPSPEHPELVRICAWSRDSDLYLEDDGGLFAPILEDDSPEMVNGDVGSSPIEPVTPFGDYVDRAVAASDATVLHGHFVSSASQNLQISINCDSYPSCPLVEAKEELVVATNEPPPSAASIQKQLAEPMAEWLVSYVWKVCTNALVLPHTFAPYSLPNAPQLCQPVPLHLIPRVHSLLMSTLLQPSAILLALWYIVRLPVYFGASGLGPEHVKERRFRVELLNDTCEFASSESAEVTATFRLIVLGCMLANKWLDDHTFSNKTWHTISNVPVQLLNKLEYFVLDILSYDLSISPSAWSRWLNHLLSCHHSFTATTYPQPIARPASTLNGLIRKTIQEIMEASLGLPVNEPVFVGVDQRLKEKLGPTVLLHEPEAFDIDLDEDGPLRAEYLPRRRVSNEDSIADYGSEFRHGPRNTASLHHPVLSLQGSISLPPPAKWSPAGDEPISRPSGHTDQMYLPAESSLAPRFIGTVPTVCHPWPVTAPPYAPCRHRLDGDYAVNAVPAPHYAYWAPISAPSAVPHPQPQCTSAEYYTSSAREYSLGRFDYRRNDVHLISDRTGFYSQPMASWTPLHQYGYVARQVLPPHPASLNYRSTWIRA